MKELSDEQIEEIIRLLKKGVPFPEDYRLNLIQYLKQLKKSLLKMAIYIDIFGNEKWEIKTAKDFYRLKSREVK